MHGQLSSWGADWDHFGGPQTVHQTDIRTVVVGLCLQPGKGFSLLRARCSSCRDLG